MFKQSRVNSWGGFLCIIIIWLKKFHLTVPTSHALGPSTTALFSHFAHNCRHQTILLILHNYKLICSISQINSKILHNYNLIPILSHHQTPSFIFIYNSNTKLRYGSTIYHVLRVVISFSFFFFCTCVDLFYFVGSFNTFLGNVNGKVRTATPDKKKKRKEMRTCTLVIIIKVC